MAALVANSLRRLRGTAVGGGISIDMRDGAITHYRERWKRTAIRHQRMRNALPVRGR
jgi:hypothetical protein